MKFPENKADCQELTQLAMFELKKYQEILDKSEGLDPAQLLQCLRILDQYYYEAAKVCNIFEIIKAIHPQQALRQHAVECQFKIQSQLNVLTTDTRLYQLIKQSQLAAVDLEDQYYLEREILNLESEGMSLSDSDRSRIAAIKDRLQQLAQQFMVNSQQPFVTVKVPLHELEASDLDLKQLSFKSGVGELTVGPANYNYIMENSKSKVLREVVFGAWNHIALNNNKVLDEYLTLSTEQAKILGFENAAAYQLCTHSPKTTFALEQFYENVANNITKKLNEELETLRQHFSLQDTKIDMCDIPYYIRQYRQGYDTTQFKTYFPSEHTTNQVIKLYEQFFDLNITLEPTTKGWGLWHNDVKVYRVETKDHDFLGHILADIYTRHGKSGMCWTVRVSSHSSGGQNNDSAVAVVLMCLSKQHLDYQSLSALFHEFGHAIHQMLGHAKWASVSGSACLTDFLEFPSQLMEEWIWDKEVLNYLASETIPEQLLSRHIQSRMEFQGNELYRQMLMGQVAFKYFLNNANSVDARREMWRQLIETTSNIAYSDSIDMTTRFVHLIMHGAKYYSYLWSRDIALRVKEMLYTKGTILQQKAGPFKELLQAGGGLSPDVLLARMQASISGLVGDLS